ncbi:MAG: hypothetical protein KA956_07735 [Pyrinomonadaceae bacterium]|nr:hypothetical protein [Pyrinomonadaceae bacterium]MBP7476292.1 hypothetical protein [Pyrinomonadaceae bacterium]
MRADWVQIKRGDVMPQYAGIYVTMNRNGDIVLSRVTYERMGAPRAFLMFFDRANKRIGLKPAAATIKDAYPAKVSNRCGAKKVCGHRMMVEEKIDLPMTVRFYDADINDEGWLILDLRTAKVSPRAKKRKSE